MATWTPAAFGPVLRGYEGRWREAALELERLQDREAPGGLHHPDVGPIALVWGKEGTARSDGSGLSKKSSPGTLRCRTTFKAAWSA